MRLTQTELDRVTVFTVAEMARRRRARGLLLNHPEAAGLIVDEMMELARAGASYEAVLARGESLLTADDVMPGVPALLRGLRCEPLFDDGPRLIVLAAPIAALDDPAAPGATEPAAGEVLLNPGREVVTVSVRNGSDHVVIVSSHYHFYEVNPRLDFDRALAYGRHLDIQAGRSVIWQPGETHEVALVPFAGESRIDGFQGRPAPDAAGRPAPDAAGRPAPDAAGRPAPGRGDGPGASG